MSEGGAAHGRRRHAGESAAARDAGPTARRGVSVVVPTRDRPESLRRCLGALRAQDLAELEVIVVDDGSRDRGAVEAALAGAAPGVRLLRTPGRGPAAARNRGVRAATGEVVCFTDDDCEPEPGWARLLAGRSRVTGSAA